MPDRVFITGISGLLGLNAALHWRSRYDVSGAYHSQPIMIAGVDAGALELTDAAAVKNRLTRARPSIVVHTAGFTSVDGCERDPERARQLHEVATRNVAAAARETGAGLIHISTDHLFDGSAPLLSEDAVPAPQNVYGATKLAAEREVAASEVDALIVRTNFYGWGTSRRASLTDWILSGLEAGRPREMFDDVFFSPIQINDLAEALMTLWHRGARGIVNVAGSDRLSKYDFGVRVADRFALDPSLVVSRSVEGFAFGAPRPRDMSLSSERASRFLGRPMPGIVEGLNRLWVERTADLPRRLEAALVMR